MIDAIAKNEHEITNDNVSTYLKRMDEVIAKTDVDAIKTQISMCK